jgi:hypothetical protein
LKKYNSIKESRAVNPYLIIAVAAILAYLPVSSMFFSLKNDVLVIEYPIQHFMSESLRNGEFPTWFNTWAMGFPLQSILSWGVYSTPQMLTGFLFKSNVFILHAEFLVYIMASGWLMYKLLKTHFLNDRHLSLLLACCYMLSGFTVGSSQWLLYITAMTFIPLVLYCLLCLLKRPSLKYVLLSGISYYLFFTNVHIYLSVVSTYIVIIFLITWFIRLVLSKNKSLHEKLKLFKFVSLALFLILILCAAPAYYSIETISYLQRSQSLANNSMFFQSNYLHPDALSSFLFPLSSVKTSHINTEGTVLNTYIGLFPLIILPASFIITLKQKNNTAWVLLLASLVFLVISFGHLTPLRSWLNVLPGMSHFRHPGVLRVFFNLAFIFYLAVSLKNYRLPDLVTTPVRKIIIITIISLIFLSLLTFLFQAGNLPGIWKDSFYQSIKNISKSELLLLSSAIQLFFLFALLFIIHKRQQLFSFFIITELVLNTLVCTPFFTVSTYSAMEVNKIFQSPQGFPIQQDSPFNVPATIKDERNNSWYNINTFRKQVSNNLSMPGPLILEKVSLFSGQDNLKQSLFAKKLVFINDTAGSSIDTIRVTEQLPGRVTVETSLARSEEVVLQQVDFPGWKTYYNNIELPLSKNNMPFVSTVVPAGRGTLIFRFKKNGVVYSAVLLHIIVLLTLSFYTIKKIIIKPSSLP